MRGSNFVGHAAWGIQTNSTIERLANGMPAECETTALPLSTRSELCGTYSTRLFGPVGRSVRRRTDFNKGPLKGRRLLLIPNSDWLSKKPSGSLDYFVSL